MTEQISIHALREEGDSLRRRAALRVNEFLSTPSARRATVSHIPRINTGSNFYPRPPRGGRHDANCVINSKNFYFYPRPPRGGRPSAATKRSGATDFYPRPPRGGRRVAQNGGSDAGKISIHALREEGDCSSKRKPSQSSNFYPRPPRGGRRGSITGLNFNDEFLSTPSARRATFPPVLLRGIYRDFYPRPPRGGRPSRL